MECDKKGDVADGPMHAMMAMVSHNGITRAGMCEEEECSSCPSTPVFPLLSLPSTSTSSFVSLSSPFWLTSTSKASRV